MGHNDDSKRDDADDRQLFRREFLENCRIRQGVYSFVEQDCDFYEGHYKNRTKYLPKLDRWPYTLPLWLINSGYLWTVRRHVPEGSRVLELGCASGVAYFGQRYRMMGLDLSLSSLEGVVQDYERCIQASVMEGLPFNDGVLDAVVSSFFWEHLDEAGKRQLGSELRRVLKPGGKVIFLYDIETNNPMIRHFKAQDEILYRRQFLEGDGHIGYHSSAKNEDIFLDAGFVILNRRGFEKTLLQSPSAYAKLKRWPGSSKRWFGALEYVAKGWRLYPYTLLMRLLNASVDRLLPREWARIERVVLMKPKGPRGVGGGRTAG